MKEIITLFPRDTYISQSNGDANKYLHDLALAEKLGQAKTIRVHMIGHRLSSNAQVTIKAWESSWKARRPIEAGKQLGSTQQITQSRPDLFSITGPFAAWVELCIEIEDSVGTDQMEADLEIHATLIFEE